MNRIIITLVAAFMLTPAWAIENGGSYDTTEPTDAQVPNWTTGWGNGGITGWNYVGQVNGASAVYLGNGWVLTAGHVGMGPFTLNGVTYQPVSGSGQILTNSAGTADLALFQISTAPALNPLTLSLNAPTAFSQRQAGSSVVMLGYGGDEGETWGYDTVDFVNQLISLTGYTYVSNDFLTIDGTYTSGKTTSPDNNSTLVDGDSGGGDFVYNTATQSWELAGINEFVGSGMIGTQNVTDCGYVQLNTYASQINAFVNSTAPVDSPTMPLPGLFLMACLLLFVASRPIERKVRDPGNDQGHRGSKDLTLGFFACRQGIEQD